MKMKILTNNVEAALMFTEACKAKDTVQEFLETITEQHDACSVTLALMMLSAYQTRKSGFVSKQEYLSQCEYFWDALNQNFN